MTSDALRADCARCAALCCVAPAFDRSAAFAYDKPAAVACRHLREDDLCRIHARRGEEGFSGCVRFDCLGAGQRVVQELYRGRSWREDPALLAEMALCFSALRRVHELLQILAEAAKLALTPAERSALTGLQRELDPPEGWSPAALLGLDLDLVNRRALAFLASLRPRADGLRNKRAAPGGGAADADRREGDRSAVLL